MLRSYLSSLLLLICISCSSPQTSKFNNEDKNVRSPEEMYIIAMSFFEKNNYIQANEEFLDLKKLYPLSNEAIQAEIMIGFIQYIEMDYESAIRQFNKIINKYPSHKDLDYIYYMRAMCNYEQISHHGLDGKYNELALDGFNQVVRRYPESKYAKDSMQKIVLVKSNKAAKHMEIGRYYLKEKKYTAALNRFKIVIDDYSMTKFTPEALHRMVEAYFEMGMIEESIKTAAVLGHNYPDSRWYRYSYNLIKKIDNENSLVDKVKNLF